MHTTCFQPSPSTVPKAVAKISALQLSPLSDLKTVPCTVATAYILDELPLVSLSEPWEETFRSVPRANGQSSATAFQAQHSWQMVITSRYTGYSEHRDDLPRALTRGQIASILVDMRGAFWSQHILSSGTLSVSRHQYKPLRDV